VVDIPNLIICANFGDDRLRGLGVAGVKFCPSAYAFVVVLTALSHHRANVTDTDSLLKLKAKFHYASWFEAGSKLVRSWFELQFGLSSGLLAAN